MIDIQTRSEIKNGNPDAFRKVFRLLYPRLKGYCKLFISEEYAVEDIIQETFISLWEKRGTIDILKTIESLIFVMVRNRCFNYLKTKQLELGRISVDDLRTPELQYLYQLDLTGKEEKSMEEMLIMSLQQEVEKLPSKMKAVFIKCKIEGRKQKEVAEELGISLKMVEKHISGAKYRIKEKLLKQYPILVVLVLMLME